DGVASADVASLQALCARFPKVKFLVTVLSRANQHELTVVVQKTRNLHLYGCWWYCNNPSIIEELTKMRVEMLGTAFTAQHSDCRVLEQLLYKWDHSREVIGQALAPYFERLVKRGWVLTRQELRRDVELLLGGSYEAGGEGCSITGLRSPMALKYHRGARKGMTTLCGRLLDHPLLMAPYDDLDVPANVAKDKKCHGKAESAMRSPSSVGIAT
ncbi:unnamed protein product, partial [Symbiodinium microadriaticum]